MSVCPSICRVSGFEYNARSEHLATLFTHRSDCQHREVVQNIDSTPPTCPQPWMMGVEVRSGWRQGTVSQANKSPSIQTLGTSAIFPGCLFYARHMRCAVFRKLTLLNGNPVTVFSIYWSLVIFTQQGAKCGTPDLLLLHQQLLQRN